MNNNFEKSATKIGAITTLLGSVCMLGGAAIGGISGADIDVSLAANDIVGYLAAANESKTILIANLSVWIVGVMLLGVAASMMTYLSRENQILSLIARYNYWIGIPIVVISYMAWLAVVVRLTSYEPSSVSTIAESVGWFAVRTDWVATVLVLGTGPLLLSLAGKNSWIPKWLMVWSYFCFVAGFLNIIAMYLGGLSTYGFLIIPVGMGWMIAAGIVLIRKSKTVAEQ
jgi:hypothetical protein